MQAKALTWLDRQAFGQNTDARLTSIPAVQDALEQRRQWLVEHGYAQRSDTDGGDVRLNPAHSNIWLPKSAARRIGNCKSGTTGRCQSWYRVVQSQGSTKGLKSFTAAGGWSS